MQKRPNVIFVFGDQHRFCDVGYSGNTQVKTPFLDKLSQKSMNFSHAISGIPVCCPYRANLMTGQYPLTHGVFMNDVCLDTGGVYLGDAYQKAGYETAYIGKWHIDGHGRESFIPKDRRHGFDYWKVLECTHDYNHSPYFGDTDEKKYWTGYDAFAQTDCAIEYIKNYKSKNPFLMVLSWGPPHNPYETAPQEFRNLYNPDDIILRENVAENDRKAAQNDLAGYYAHISALDHALEKLFYAAQSKGIEDDTIFIYTSDHGDMHYSQGTMRKQRPWEESIRVPFLLHYPRLFGNQHMEMDELFNSPDIMPTLLGLCGIEVPKTVEGINFAPFLRGEELNFHVEATMIECIQPFGEFLKEYDGRYGDLRLTGGREYRGIRTPRYTYVKDRNSEWLLYDNQNDPFQKENLCGNLKYQALQEELDAKLKQMLKERKDDFLEGTYYTKKWGYELDDTGTVLYHG